MSEEEKKAIEKIKEAQERMIKPKMLKDVKYTNEDYSKAIEIILNVIDKQQKEIEEKNIAINKMSKDISRQLEEIEEKSTILMAGAEKVKELEKGNRSLMESRIKWKNRYYKEKARNKERKAISQAIIRDTFKTDYISKDKIREKLKELEEQFKKYENEGLSGFVSKIDKGTRIEVLKELLEEK